MYITYSQSMISSNHYMVAGVGGSIHIFDELFLLQTQRYVQGSNLCVMWEW